jgi:hypothetical protein
MHVYAFRPASPKALLRPSAAGAFRQPVDAMTSGEARALLSGGLPGDQVIARSRELSDLAGRLGEWGQLLKLVNDFLRERVIDGRESLRDAVADANARLNEEGFGTFDAADAGDRTKAVACTINLTLGFLDDKERARFGRYFAVSTDAADP